MSEPVVDRTFDLDMSARLGVRRGALLWLLFLLMCLGLGYPTLNRYDPVKVVGTSDSGVYRNIVIGAEPVRTPGDALTRLTHSENYGRVLVPYVARPFYWIARGHVRTWDPAFVGLLMSNAIFVATTACLLMSTGVLVGLTFPVVLLGATVYLLNFSVANFDLAGLIDSGEGCMMMAVVWSLLTDRWFLLPLWGIAGALAKETFASFSVLMAFAWWLSEVRPARWRLSRLVWIGALAVAGFATVVGTMSVAAGGIIWPWQFAVYMRADAGFLKGFLGCCLDHTFWYIFGWLLPLGGLRLTRLPRPWVLGSALTFFLTLFMGAYNNALGNTSRALFNVAGPILSLSAAAFLVDLGPKGDDSGTEVGADCLRLPKRV